MRIWEMEKRFSWNVIKNILLKENYHIYTLKNVYPKLLSADIKNIVETTGKKVVIN